MTLFYFGRRKLRMLPKSRFMPLSAKSMTASSQFLLSGKYIDYVQPVFHKLLFLLLSSAWLVFPHSPLSSKNISRLRLALILLAMENGGHVDMHGVEFIQCTAYRLEPITPGSFNDLDGEVVEAGPIQGTVLPEAVEAYCDL